jgi:hypothetical protein
VRNYGSNRGWDKGSFFGCEVEAEFGGLALEVGQFALALLGFITLRPNVLMVWAKEALRPSTDTGPLTPMRWLVLFLV